MEEVKAWIEKIIIPTYEVSAPERYPIFLEKRVYQGSSGSVYPHPVIEKVSDKKVDKEWEVVYLENKYLKIMVLPALGGRIQMAFDKIKNRHFVYYNEVIKPALVGLTGPWISGGIEFNWPQHHRPSTYDPVDFKIEHHDDGSATVWVSEIERMFGTKGMAGFKLFPDKAFLEVNGRLYNRTPHPQTFLWWANPAVAVNDHYQSVFPEDVNAVFDHGKRDVSRFPIATGTYYKMDYSSGVDISKYKNIPVPTSYMAVNSEYDFVGGYEHDTQAGLLHVADHHVSPGKKQWTWGNGDFGKAWDRNLTDSNGPYIELMCGVFTDNQPDFSWIQPYEERSFKQYFMPYHSVGVVKNATKEALINVLEDNGKVRVIVYVTSEYLNCRICLYADDKLFLDETVDLDPANCFDTTLDHIVKEGKFTAEVLQNNGRKLVTWTESSNELKPLPDAAKPAKDPKDILTIEELYLTGIHIEQYRHATYSALQYYDEALIRNPQDIRSNNAKGLFLLKSGEIKKALSFFDNAIEASVRFNPNPYDGEPYFNKGMALKYLGDFKNAFDAFQKACWNAAWQDAAFFQITQLEIGMGNLYNALECIEKSLLRNWHNHKARHLKVAILRNLGMKEKALILADESLKIDQFNFGVLFERYLMTNSNEDLSSFQKLTRNHVHNFIEIGLDYQNAGLFKESIQLLNIYKGSNSEVYPLVNYMLGYLYLKSQQKEKAAICFKEASMASGDYFFPNRIEEMIILKHAVNFNPTDHKGFYYLGNYWMSKKNYQKSKNCWENSLKFNKNAPIVLRNLALIYFNKLNLKNQALEFLEKAFSHDNQNPRLLMELDQLYKKLNKPVSFRLEFLKDYNELVMERDDVYLEYVTLLNISGLHEAAIDLLLNRRFHPWEGGEGKVPEQYIIARIELAKSCLNLKKFEEATKHLLAAREYPENFGEGKLMGAAENDILYYLGNAYSGLGDEENARKHWEMASVGSQDLGPALYYNDQSPDKIFYQGKAFLKLGKTADAMGCFNKLIDYGEKHIFDKVKIDYFAVSLPDLLIWEEDLEIRNLIHCNYLIGLGKLGKLDSKGALKAFETGLNENNYHLGLVFHKKQIGIG